MKLRLWVCLCVISLSASVLVDAQRYRMPFKIRTPIPATVEPEPPTEVILPGIPILTSNNPQTIINGYPAGSVFLFKAGYHRERTISPRTGDTYNFEVGAILSGAKVLSSFTTSGAYWRTTGNTQTQELPYRFGDCQVAGSPAQLALGPGWGVFSKSWPRCTYNEELFFDGVRQQHEPVLSQVGPGEWWFDYDSNVIYMGSNPNLATLVETTTTQFAFEPTGDNVTFRRATVQMYGSPAQQGAFHTQENDATTPRSGWKILDSFVLNNHGGGIRTGHGMEVGNTKVCYNGQIGIVGIGTNVLIHDNEICYNNDAHFDQGWEAGGTKFVATTNLILRNNNAHHNKGPALWTDIDNFNALFEGNLTEYNDRMGIFHEISDSAIIRNNTVRNNGFEFSPWIWGCGILVAGSRDVQIYGNTLEGNADGICGVSQSRGTSSRYGYLHQLINLDVHDNATTQDSTSLTGDPSIGIAQDVGDNTFFTSRNNRFYRNTYRLKSNTNYFNWMNGSFLTFAAWQGYGQDTVVSGGTSVVY